MGERVSLGGAGRWLGVSGGGICRAGYAKVTAGRLEAWEHEPPAWLREARARRRRPGPRRAGVWCCVCGTVREARPGLTEECTHLVRGPCGRSGERPEVPSRPGMMVVRAFNPAGYASWIAAAGERASVCRAAALARAGFLNAAGEPES